MGKGARLRRQRELPLADRSAFARIYREARRAQARFEGGGPTDRVAAEMAKFVSDRLPRARVYRYHDWGIPELPLASLGSQLHEVCFPFPLVLLDAGPGVNAGTTANGAPIELVGVLCSEAEHGLWEKPTAIGFCVVADGTDEWWMSPILPLFEMNEGYVFGKGDSEIADESTTATAAKATLTMLAMLDCANVEVLPALDPPAQGHVAHGTPHYEVLVSQRPTRRESPEQSRRVDWSHRWEVAAHFNHVTRGATYDANPDRRVVCNGVSCVLTFTPSYIKGPPDKPLIPKIRHVRVTA